MWFWPFSRKPLESPSPVELRDRLIEAARSGSQRELKRLCRAYARDVAANLESFHKVPEEIRNNEAAAGEYVQALMVVARCLAVDARTPQLWNALTQPSADSPFERWNRWLTELPTRMERLEYESLLEEVHGHLEQTKSLSGTGAQWLASTGHGRLGELLFHSGRVAEAVEPFECARMLCVEAGDTEGHRAYLEALLECHRYLNDGHAPAMAEAIVDVLRSSGVPAGDDTFQAAQHRAKRLRAGEPLLEVVVHYGGHTWRVDDITRIGDGSYQFLFQRNRPDLRKASTLVRMGNELGSKGSFADAIERYREAMEVDPHDPDPHFQAGNSYLDMGLPAAAVSELEIVQELAPGWFQSRYDLWLARGWADGENPEEACRVARMLENGGLKPKQARQISQQTLVRFPEFAPLHLEHGKALLALRDERGAANAFRRGLEFVDEPDLESRLAVNLASLLPGNDPDRRRCFERAVALEGNPVARASARLSLLVNPTA